MFDFTYVCQASPYARIVAQPSGDTTQFQTNSTTRMELNSNGATFPGDVTINGSLTAGNMQPLLSSVADDGTTFHTVLGQAGTSAENKLKAMSAGPGLKVLSSFDSLSYMWDPSNYHAVSGFGDRNQVHTSGSWAQVAAGTWGCFGT